MNLINSLQNELYFSYHEYMSQFHIRSQPLQSNIRFAGEGVRPVKVGTAEEQDTNLLTNTDSLKLSATQRDSLSSQPDNLEELMGQAPEEPKSKVFVERISTRSSGVSLTASKGLKLEVQAESAAPELLTADKDPDLMNTLQNTFSNPHEQRSVNSLQSQPASAGTEQVIKTGAKVKAGQHVQFQVGLTSRVDTEQLRQMDTGVYAGVAVESQSVSTRLNVDTVFGKPRFEVGAAMNASENATVGVSFQQSSHEQFSAIRVGTEVKVSQDATLGVNLNQPMSSVSNENRGTSVGLYLNSKFD